MLPVTVISSTGIRRFPAFEAASSGWSGVLDSGPVLVWSQPASGEGGVSPEIWLSSGAIKERMLWREALVTA